MSTNQSNAYNSNFDGIHVSKGFVRSLQGQVLKLEQIQQSLIQQLEHANRLATEYHATAVMYQKSYDEAMHKMDEMKNAFEIESAKWNSTSNEIMDKYEKEKQLRIARDEDIMCLERLLAERCVIENNYGENNDDDGDGDGDGDENEESPSPVHPQRYHEYGYDYGYGYGYGCGCGDDCGYNYDEYNINEPMSPVSVPSPRPSASPSRLQTQGPMLLFPETPKSQDDDDEDQNQSQNEHQQDDEDDDDTDDETEREFHMRYYYDSQSSRTTDCSGDPICHSDTDSD
jgi:hypothetical protein